MTRTDQTVTLRIAKQGAFYHGLATLLSQPSPVLPRASPKKPSSPQVGKHRPHEEGPPPYNGNQDMERNRPNHHHKQQLMAQSRSSPSLNKYRKGISHKDMETIYQGRPALWRLIMEHDLQAFIEKRGPDPESSPGAFSYQNPQSNSASAIEELDNVLRGAEEEVSSDKENVRGVPRGVRKARSARRKTETDIDMRKMQADLRNYKSVAERGRAQRPDILPLRERSKSFSEMDKKGLRQKTHAFTANYRPENVQGQGHMSWSGGVQRRDAPYNMTPTLAQSKSVENIKDKAQYCHAAYNYNHAWQNSQSSLQRSKSVGNFDRNSHMKDNINEDIHAQIIAAQKRRSQSAIPDSYHHRNPPQLDGYEHNLHSHSQYHGQSHNKNNNNINHGRSRSLDRNSQSQQAMNPHIHSDKSQHRKAPSCCTDSYDSGRYSDSLQSRSSYPSHDKGARSSPPSSIGSYQTFREKIHHNLSDSGISSRDSRGSYYLDEHRISTGVLNSTMRDPYGSLSSSNSVSFTMGGSHITRNPRNKFITRSRDHGPPGKAVSMGNIRDQAQHSPSNRMHPVQQSHMREPDPKSKSIPNLRMDNSFDQREPASHSQHNQMRPAASVGALQHQGAHFNDYYNQGRPDPRGNDYENHPSVDPRMHKGHMDPRRNDYPDMNQNVPPGHFVKPQMRQGSDGPPSSRNSGSSFRDDRPQSAYYGQPQMEKPDFGHERPKSMEVTLDRMQDMHQRFGVPQHSPHQSPHESSFENDRDPNYMNTRAQRQPAMQSGYVNQSDIPKLAANNEARQLNFYENTSPRQNEPSPAFNQLRRPMNENENKVRPQTMPKPSVAPKPNAPKSIPADIPRVDVDNRQTQSNFFDPNLHGDPRMMKVPASSHQNYIPGQPHLSHSQGLNSLPHNKMMPSHMQGREMYNTVHRSPELPPPPQDIAPELPPPPAPEDLPEELPPLPPPPVNDYRMDSMDPQYANHGDPRSFGASPGYNQSQFNQPQQRVQPHVQEQRFGNDRFRDNPDKQRVMGYAEPQRQQLSMVASVPRGFQPNNDYQNIQYERQNRPFDSPSQHSPGHNVYESYDPKSRATNSNVNIQQNKNRLMAEMNERSKKDGNSPLTSPWEREEQERNQKFREEEMSKLRDQEIQDLESRPYLSPQEQDRLKKLRLEQEFQRRVQEVSGRDEDDEDSDTDISSRTQGRDFLIQTIQEDIQKAQRRLDDLNHKQQYEEYQREKERMQKLERKLEMFEKEREERQQRLQKRQEKKMRDQEDYQRKQRELREKQRQEYEEQKRLLLLEEERVKKRQEEEERKRKEFERERLQELTAQREREEAALRAEARRREEEFQRQQMEIREREMREKEREIRVAEERKRLDALSLNQSHSPGYQQYANLPATQSQYGAPPPPQRGSSYDIANNSSMGRTNVGRNDVQQNSLTNNGFRNGGVNAPSSMRNMPENTMYVPKKSVSFNSQLETRNTYSVGSEDRSSLSSYRTNSVSSDQNTPSSPSVQNSYIPQTNNVNDSVFDSHSTPQQNHVNYRTAESTPTVVGAQEVYRDPRSKIQAKREGVIKKTGNADRMSFRDKMKFFASEAGESTPKEKAKASKTLRDIESQLHNGQ